MTRQHGDPTGPARAVPWVSSMVYAIVGVAGLYYEAADLDGDGAREPVRTVGFAACLALLFALEFAERRSFPARTPAAPAVAFLTARLALFVAVSALDPSGLSRALFVLVPFAAYLAFGRTVSLALAAVCLGLLLGGYTVWVPGWYTEATYVSDLLMFSVGLALAIAMAGIAVREQRGRLRLEESHARLSAYADRVAALSATAERNRLARDIHDSLGHHLTAVAVQLEKPPSSATATGPSPSRRSPTPAPPPGGRWRTCATRCAPCARNGPDGASSPRWPIWCGRRAGSARRSR